MALVVETGSSLEIAAIETAMERTWAELRAVLDRFSDPLPDRVDEGGWDLRHVLSHVIGALTRIPVHAGFYLTDAPLVPIQVHHSYWIDEWRVAPLTSFRLALEAAYAGNRALLAQLDTDALGRSRPTPFGELTLRELLMLSYERHIGGIHLPQLAAFLL